MAEEEIARSFSPGVTIFVPGAVALFMLNHKRRSIEEIEQRRGVRVYLQADDELTPPEYRLDRIKQLNPGEEVQPRAMEAAPIIEDEPDDLTAEELEAETVEAEAPEETEEQAAAGSQGERERGGRRKRRRRGRGGKFRADEFTESEGSEDSPAQPAHAPRPEPAVTPIVALSDNGVDEGDDEDEDSDDGAQASGREGEETNANGEPRRRRRRGRRGGRRRSRRPDREQSGEAQARPEGWQDRPQSDEAAGQPVPGLGDQPELPELPEQWAQRVAPLTGDAGEPAAASAGS
jgi:ribonuclease E